MVQVNIKNIELFNDKRKEILLQCAGSLFKRN